MKDDQPVHRTTIVHAAPRYRLLTGADKVQCGDEALQSDGETWVRLDAHQLLLGCPYRPGIFLPVRRGLANG